MNNLVRYKKKKSKKADEPNSIKHNSKNNEQSPEQFLFNISNCQDLSENKKQLNPEADIFNSVSFQQNQSLAYINHVKPIPETRMTRNHPKNKQVLELQNFMDKKFIQQSKKLLQLYENHSGQKFHSQPSYIHKDSELFAKFNKQKPNILQNLIHSDTVFVAKRKLINQKVQNQQKYQKFHPFNQQKYQTFQPLYLKTKQKKTNQKPSRNHHHNQEIPTFRNRSNRKFRYSLEIKSNLLLQRLNNASALIFQTKQSSPKQQNDIKTKQTFLKRKNDIQTKQSSLKQQNYMNKETPKRKIFFKTEIGFGRGQERSSNSFRKRFTFYKNQKGSNSNKVTI